MSFFKNLFKPNSASTVASWSDFGIITDSFEIKYLHPDHVTYPSWPGGDRYLSLLKTNWNTQIVFTQGLSSVNSQSEYEVYLETPDNVEAFSSSWQSNLVYEMGRLMPKVPDIKERLLKYQYLSVQIQIDGAPDEWSISDPNGNIGIFVGLENSHIKNVRFKFIPINIKLMRPTELQYAIENGNEGRNLLASLYSKQGGQTLSFLDRLNVI